MRLCGGKTAAALFFCLLALLILGTLPRPSVDARTDAPAPHHWLIQVDNETPGGHSWSFNTFYPQVLQARAGDSITFRVADNPNAFHRISLLPNGLTPVSGYLGFSFPDPYLAAGAQTTWFAYGSNRKPPPPPCGLPEETPCTFDGTAIVNTPLLVTPPPGREGAGTLTAEVSLDPKATPGSYYFFCLIHGSDMNGRIDVLPGSAPVQSDADIKRDVDRVYGDDLVRLARAERETSPPEFANNVEDGTTTWHITAGTRADSRLAVNEFGVPGLIIAVGDTVEWSVRSPGAVYHAINGFATETEQAVPRLNPIEPGCQAVLDPASIPPVAPYMLGSTAPVQTIDVRTSSADDGAFPWGIWNSCPGEEIALVTDTLARPASGSKYQGGTVTSGLLMSEQFLSGPAGRGLPYSNSYSLRFNQTGTYQYFCAVHTGMIGFVTVLSRPPFPPGTPSP